MSNEGEQSVRTWEVVANEAFREKDPQRFIELFNELKSLLPQSRKGTRSRSVRVKQ